MMRKSDLVSKWSQSLGLGLIVALAGCALDTEASPESGQGPSIGDLPGPEAVAARDGVLGEFVMRVDPRQKTLVISRIHRSSGAGKGPESFDSLSVEQDGNPGTGTANNVELVTNSVTFGSACSGGLAASFCGSVTLRSFYGRPLNNVHVQVTSITDINGAPFSTFHGGINSDASPAIPATQLDASLGLWRHPVLGAAQTFLGTTAATNNATRNWVFADPDGATTNITLRVVASLTYKDYEKTSSSQAFIDACTLTGKVSNTAASAGISAVIPFPFTFYGTSATTKVIYNRDGVFAFGGTLPPSADNGNASTYTFKDVLLPETPTTKSVSPAAYVFWDGLNSNLGGLICHGTSGTTPNQKFVMTWKNLKGFSNPDGSTNLTFSAILSEGVDTIDYVYSTMTSAVGNDAIYPTMTNAQRAAGKNAVIGVQGPAGSVNISTPFPATIGGAVIASGSKLRFRPIP